jgi:O-antigen/teichoic acid export membrane protein
VAVLGFLQGVMITRSLGAESYGVFALVMTTVMVVSQVFDSRIWETIIRHVPHYRERPGSR